MVGDEPDRHGSLPLFHSDEAIVIRSQFWAGCEEDVGCILYDEKVDTSALSTTRPSPTGCRTTVIKTEEKLGRR